MAKQGVLSLPILLLVLLFHCITTTSAQPAAAPAKPADAPAQLAANPPVQPAKAPAQPPKAPSQSALIPVQKGPTDVTKILKKAGGYSVFIRLLKSTGVAGQLFGELNDTNNIGFTIFAPTDSAFSDLKAGTLNSLSDLQKTQLIQFHILNTIVTLSNFQTLSNPVPTEAGDVSENGFQLNVTTAGNQVNISTGLVNTTLGGTVYSDDQLAIYQVSKVLLPLNIFSPKPKVAAAPLSSKPETDADAAESPSGASKVDEAAAVRLCRHETLASIGVAVIAFFVMKGT